MSSVWKSAIVYGGADNDEKQVSTALDKMEELRREVDGLGGQAVQDILFG